MKLLIVGVWAVVVTLGAGWGAATFALSSQEGEEKPILEGLQYTSLPTMSVPIVDRGKVEGYVVIRVVYTVDSAVLKNLAAEPDAFITDEVFRTVYGTAETDFGKLRRLDLDALATDVKSRVNERMGDAVVQDVLVDGLNYIDLNAADSGRSAAVAVGAAEMARDTAAARSSAGSGH